MRGGGCCLPMLAVCAVLCMATPTRVADDEGEQAAPASGTFGPESAARFAVKFLFPR